MDKHLFIPLSKTAERDPIRLLMSNEDESVGDKPTGSTPVEDIRLELVLKLIVSEWQDNADPSFPIESRWLHVASPVPGVPRRKVNGKMEYQWNISTARNWIEWLSALLEKIRDASASRLEEKSDHPQKIKVDSLRKLTGNLGIHSSLVASGQLNDMLAIPPITRVLRRYIISMYGNTILYPCLCRCLTIVHILQPTTGATTWAATKMCNSELRAENHLCHGSLVISIT